MPPAFALSQDQTLRFIMPDALQHQAIRSPISSSHSLRQSQPSIYDQPGPRLSTQQVNPPGADHASHPVSKTRQNNKPSQSITRIAKTLHKKNQMHLSKSAQPTGNSNPGPVRAPRRHLPVIVLDGVGGKQTGGPFGPPSVSRSVAVAGLYAG